MVDGIANAVVYFFNDLIFMNLMGWWARPFYNYISRVSAEVVAKVMLFIVETAFWTIIVVLIVKLVDKLLSKRMMSRENRLEMNKQRIEKNRRIREARKEREQLKNANSSDNDDDEGDYKEYDA